MRTKLSILLLVAIPLLLALKIKPTPEDAHLEAVQYALRHSYATVYRHEATRTNDVILSCSVAYVEKFSRLLNLEGADDTLLAMYHIESRFDITALGDDKKCFGIGQTLITDEPKWRSFWKRRGIILGPDTNLETQVAFSVAEFQAKLQLAHGDLRESVRRYNGAGPRARNYAHLVMRARRIIFKHPYVKGEFVSGV